MIIIKIGGGQDMNIKGIINDISKLREKENESFIIIHGANTYRDELAQKLNIEKTIITSVSGYSSVYSDEQAINLLMMAYAGLRNKRIVEMFQIAGINAVGLSGIDGKIIQGRRNKGIRVKENNKTKIKRDMSGKPFKINTQLLNILIENGYTPILTVPILDEKGFAINSENDDIVVELQKSVGASKIIQLIEASGLLRDFRDKNSTITTLSITKLEEMEKISKGRIKRKLLALKKLSAFRNCDIFISDGRIENPLINAISGYGTRILRS